MIDLEGKLRRIIAAIADLITRPKGLDDIYDEIEIVEEHFHNIEYTLPVDLTAPITITSAGGANTFGAWILVANAGAVQAAIGAGNPFDPGKYLYDGATNARIFQFEVGYGDGSPTTTTCGGDIFSTNGGVVSRSSTNDFKCNLITENGSGLYVRCMDDNGGSSFDIFLRIHGY